MRWQVYDLGALTATELRMAVRRSIAQSLGRNIRRAGNFQLSFANCWNDWT